MRNRARRPANSAWFPTSGPSAPARAFRLLPHAVHRTRTRERTLARRRAPPSPRGWRAAPRRRQIVLVISHSQSGARARARCSARSLGFAKVAPRPLRRSLATLAAAPPGCCSIVPSAESLTLLGRAALLASAFGLRTTGTLTAMDFFLAWRAWCTASLALAPAPAAALASLLLLLSLRQLLLDALPDVLLAGRGGGRGGVLGAAAGLLVGAALGTAGGMSLAALAPCLPALLVLPLAVLAASLVRLERTPCMSRCDSLCCCRWGCCCS
jgi:hypothetical protein